MIKDSDYKIIITTNGSEIIVDNEDYDNLRKYSVSLVVNGKYGLFTDEYGNRKYIHRYVMNVSDSFQVDHINMNTLDNRKSNLRIASMSQNRANQEKVNYKHKELTSRYKGVIYDKMNKNWLCRVVKNREVLFKERFKDETSAALAYNHYATLIFGEFARLNIVNADIDWEKNRIIRGSRKSGYKYIHKTKNSTYCSQLSLNNEKIFCKNFKTLHEAVLLTNSFIIEHGLHKSCKYRREIQELLQEDIDLLSKQQLTKYKIQMLEKDNVYK